MLQDEKSKEIAMHLLKYGWVEATDENLWMYLNAFSKRKNLSMQECLDMLESSPKETYKDFTFQGKKKTENLLFGSESNFLVDSEPFIQEDFIEEEFDESWPPEKKVNSIVQRERRRISRMVDDKGIKYDIIHDSLKGDCTVSSEAVIDDCNEKNINVRGIYTRGKSNKDYYLYKINGKDIKLAPNLGHCFSLLGFKEGNFLIDCTYRQFFTEFLNGAYGRFMLCDENRSKVAMQILKYGYIEATPENIKAYMDGFMMAQLGSNEPISITGEEYLEIFNVPEKTIPLSEIGNVAKRYDEKSPKEIIMEESREENGEK